MYNIMYFLFALNLMKSVTDVFVIYLHHKVESDVSIRVSVDAFNLNKGHNNRTRISINVVYI